HANLSQTCHGDSGGPVLVQVGEEEMVAGFTSSGDDTCSEYGRDVRMDTFRDFLAGDWTPDAPTLTNTGCSTSGRKPSASGQLNSEHEPVGDVDADGKAGVLRDRVGGVGDLHAEDRGLASLGEDAGADAELEADLRPVGDGVLVVVFPHAA